MKPKHLDLHTGIGGFALAAKWSGYETVAFAEIEPYCHELLTTRFPRIPNYGDVRKLCKRIHDCTAPPWLDEAEAIEMWNTGEDVELWCPICDAEFSDCECTGTDEFLDIHGQPDIISSGFPCQDISLNGKGAGLAGSRSSLWNETARIAGELAPPFVVFENVAALKNRGFDQVAADLEAIGYAVGAVSVTARSIGAEHKRERIFGVAYDTSQRMEGVRAEGLQEPQPLAQSPLPLRSSDGQWQIEPDFRRTHDGLSGRMDRSARKSDRLRAIGNAIVPQIAAAIFDILPYLAKKHAV